MNIDPNATLQTSAQFGWAVFVLVLFTLLAAGGAGLYFWKILVPEARQRLIESQARQTAMSQQATALHRLADSANLAHANANATNSEISDCLQRLCMALEHRRDQSAA